MKTVSIDKTIIRVSVKCHLTDLQYNGGPGLTPADHMKVGEVLQLCFGNYKRRVPADVCTAQWGFKAWADFIEAWADFTGDPKWIM